MSLDFAMLHNQLICDADRTRTDKTFRTMRKIATAGEMEERHILRRHEDGRPSLIGRDRQEPTCYKEGENA